MFGGPDMARISLSFYQALTSSKHFNQYFLCTYVLMVFLIFEKLFTGLSVIGQCSAVPILHWMHCLQKQYSPHDTIPIRILPKNVPFV